MNTPFYEKRSRFYAYPEFDETPFLIDHLVYHDTYYYTEKKP
ncbi:hypothetical protein L965_1913 [Leuconostoc pseudomesenteroides PS12]|nr:hypothetical protein L965_1913 [Leuconostoc pseudomesenteroides PS12]